MRWVMMQVLFFISIVIIDLVIVSRFSNSDFSGIVGSSL